MRMGMAVMVMALLCLSCSSEGFEGPDNKAGASGGAGVSGAAGQVSADAGDLDGDGFTEPLDCDDTDPNVHPAIEGKGVSPQTTPTKAGLWDYDCDGIVEKAYPEVYDCGNTPAWESGPVPECGQSANLWTGWALGSSPPCGTPHTLVTTTQACR